MTSQSLRKHPTTRPSTLRSNPADCERRRAVGISRLGPSIVALLSFVAVLAAVSISGMLQAQEDAELTPLERLKQRSAEARWQELRSRWLEPTDDTSSSGDLAESTSPGESIHRPESQARPFPDESIEADATQDRIAEPPRFAVDQETQLKPVAVEPRQPDPVATAEPIPATDTAIPQTGDVQASSVSATAEPFTSLEDGPVIPPLPTRADSEPRRVAQANPPAPAPLQSTGQEQLDLKPITDIEPFFDYDPLGEDPCANLCPRPTEGPCADGDYKRCPDDLQLPSFGSPHRAFGCVNYYWAASNLYYNPLYFQDVQLERYGHTHHPVIQPVVSVAKFSGQFLALPYKMAIDPVHERKYSLGYYRPGEVAPKQYLVPPFNLRAAALAGGVYTGFFFLIP